MAYLTLEAWRDGGACFSHQGHDIFYRVAGSPSASPALLCIHGFPTASWDWHRVWDDLAARFGCIVTLDMIGFGLSAKPHPYAYAMADQADIHEELLRRLGVRRVHVLAHDYGDTVAQELLARHEERRPDGLELQSVCFLNGGLFPETHHATPGQLLLAGPDGPTIAALMTEETYAQGMATVFGPQTKPSAEEMHAFWRLTSASDGTALMPALLGYMEERRRHRERWVGALQRTRVPLRMIDGPEDPVSGAHMAARYRELVPDPDVVLLPGIGHYPQVEDPDGVVRAVLEFHARLGTPTPVAAAKKPGL
jgi:pimeloyl-ACP methyl ester carboxylesterase